MAANLFDSVSDLAQNLDQISIKNAGYITLSQRHKPQLCYDGYYYREATKASGASTWSCVTTNLKCNARVATFGNNVGESFEVTIINDVHNHGPDVNKQVLLGNYK